MLRRTPLLPALGLALPVLVGITYALLASLGVVGAGASGGAFTRETLGFAPSFKAWQSVLTDRATWSGVGWSVWVAGASTALASVGAVCLAVAFRGHAPLDRFARGLAIVPLPIPHLVAGVGGILVLGQSGVLARVLYAGGWITTPGGMPALVQDPWGIGVIVALAWKELPFLAFVAFSVLASRGVKLEEAARTLGAPARSVFRHITAPTLVRGLMPAVVAVFVFVAGSWEVAALLAPSDPMALPLQILERQTDPALGRRAEAHVLTLLAFVLAALAVALHEVLRHRAERGAR